MQSGRQFEYVVVLDSELDSNSAIPNWLVGHLRVHISLALQHLLDAPFVLHGPLLDF
jgi:hypothetical protein